MKKFSKIILLLSVLFVSTAAYAQYEELTSTYFVKYESKDMPVRLGLGHEISVGLHYWGFNYASGIANNYSPEISYICSYRFNNVFDLGVGISTLMMFNYDDPSDSDTHVRRYGNIFANIRMYMHAQKKMNTFINLAIGLDMSYYNIKHIPTIESINNLIYRNYRMGVALYSDCGIGANLRFNQDLSLTGSIGINTYRLPSYSISSDEHTYYMKKLKVSPYLRIGFHF